VDAGPTITVTVSPAVATLPLGGAQAFVATVAGTSNTSVSWTVQEADGGAIDGAGNYTAPESPGAFHVVATSNADPAARGTAAVNVVTGRFLIAPSASEGLVRTFAIDPSMKALRPHVNAATVEGSSVVDAVLDPAGTRLFALNGSTTNKVSVFSVDATTGALAEVAGSPFPTGGNGGVALAMHPSGRTLYVVSQASHDIAALTIAAGTGALSALGVPVSVPVGQGRAAVDPSGKFLYQLELYGGVVVGFSIDGTGALTPLASSPFACGTQPAAIAFDPKGAFVFVANLSSNNLSAYRINSSTGALTQVAGSPFGTGLGPSGVTVDPAGRRVLVVNGYAGSASVFSLDASTGALTQVAGSPFTSPGLSGTVAVDPGGRLVYSGSYDVAVYDYAASGALTFQRSYRSGGYLGGLAPTRGTSAVAFEPAVALSVNGKSKNLSGFTVNPSTGALTAAPGVSAATTDIVGDLAVDPLGRRAFIAGAGSMLYAFTLDAAGSLTPVAGYPKDLSPRQPYSMTLDPGGRFLLMVDGADYSVAVFKVLAAGGIDTTPVSVTAANGAGTVNGQLRVDPTGRFVYVSHAADSTVTALKLSPTGVLSSVSGSPFTPGANPVTPATFDPAGRFAYFAFKATLAGESKTVRCGVDNNGVLSLCTPFEKGNGGDPQSTGTAIDPFGRFLYASNGSSTAAGITAYSVGPSDGALTVVDGGPFAAPAGSLALTADPSGRFVYAVNGLGGLDGGLMSGFAVNPGTGALSPIAGSPWPVGDWPAQAVIAPRVK
jgi:6-phosphogluconolactonase (cycloisomerase 2 family)